MLIQKIILVDSDIFQKLKKYTGTDLNFSAWVREKMQQELYFLAKEPLDMAEKAKDRLNDIYFLYWVKSTTKPVPPAIFHEIIDLTERHPELLKDPTLSSLHHKATEFISKTV